MISGKVFLLPAPTLAADWTEKMSRRVAEVENCSVRVGRTFTVRSEYYNSSRLQYRGEDILYEVCTQRGERSGRVVALVDHDCYGASLTFVFGQASLRGGCAFVALARLRNSFWGKPPDDSLFALRVVKEIVHELGHTWGLPHCADPKCVMHFSNTIADTDRKGPAYCAICHSKRNSCGGLKPIP
ncbi:MAG: archaemetzincin family Zn-dependent metalloprotease [Chitinivibrionales bacterium]|nr:archaemetzincin family Zn-dependent metalloprotease [Chitinivibrionales bacterium]MBD3356454.1 archaemetzincin family Zn-dependent metalloprotease [Chitinivibrionales bacterium]